MERQEHRDPRRALAEADRASHAMVASSEPPRSFTLIFVALIATIFATLDVVTWPVTLGLFALMVGLWYVVFLRNRPRPRYPLWSSGTYVGYGLLLMAVLHVSGWWPPESWAGIGVKWIALFGACWFCLWRLQAVSVRDRLRESQQKHV